MTSQPLFQNIFILRRPSIAIFVDIIKTLTVFIKEFFQHSGKVQRIGSYVSKCSLYMYFLIYQNLLISGKKSLMSAELKRCVT